MGRGTTLSRPLSGQRYNRLVLMVTAGAEASANTLPDEVSRGGWQRRYYAKRVEAACFAK